MFINSFIFFGQGNKETLRLFTSKGGFCQSFYQCGSRYILHSDTRPYKNSITNYFLLLEKCPYAYALNVLVI